MVDNGSSDDTGRIAKACGATVILEKQKGYGYACLKGINYLENYKMQKRKMRKYSLWKRNDGNYINSIFSDLHHRSRIQGMDAITMVNQ